MDSMRLRIEIREGPPSMYNPEAVFYVVAIHPQIGVVDKDTGEPVGEKMLGGPMTENNALGMIEAIRHRGLPDELLTEPLEPTEDGAEEHEAPGKPDIEGMDLPPPPARPEPPSPSTDLLIPLAYLLGIGLFVIVVVYVLGLR
jgi:hypothetical protein